MGKKGGVYREHLWKDPPTEKIPLIKKRGYVIWKKNRKKRKRLQTSRKRSRKI